MTTKTDKIRKLIAAGHRTKEIVALAKCKPQNVYQVRYWDKKKKSVIFTKPMTLLDKIKKFFRSK